MSGLVHWLLRRYARATAAVVRPFIVGDRVLDLGAGEGYVGAALRRSFPGWMCAADIGSFGRIDGAYVVYDGVGLPFADGVFDTTLLLLTLHHCAEPERVLDEAVRVTGHRLIVTESVSRDRLDRFWLDLLDGRLNHHRHAGTMALALHFKPPDEWAALFQTRNLRVAHQRWLGSRWERLVHHPLLFVLDKSATPVMSGPGGAGAGGSCQTRFPATIQPSPVDGKLPANAASALVVWQGPPAPAPPGPAAALAGSPSTKRIG